MHQSRAVTRQSLVDAAEEGRDFVVTKGRQVRDQAGQYTERGKEVLAAQKEQFKAAYDAGVRPIARKQRARRSSRSAGHL